MANYQYDQGGSMAAYFLITVLLLVLVPLTLSLSVTSGNRDVDGCRCQPCLDQRERIRKREHGSSIVPRFSGRAQVVTAGWALLFFLAYKVSRSNPEQKLYDPFDILGLRAGVTEKEIKSHYKKLSKVFHPDKVKPAINQTLEEIANKFVEITKAYKSLTDETIRRNWELYGHPDGRQEISIGIALPPWIIEGKNNIWVLGFYGIVFGGALPVLVGRWWFGHRRKTKDGVDNLTAAAFFKSIREESGVEEVLGALCRAFEWEGSGAQASSRELDLLEAKIGGILKPKWDEVKKAAGIDGKGAGAWVERRRRALILIHAHLLRIPLTEPALQNDQASILTQMPTLLSALLTITTSRNWLPPALSIMRLHAYLTQALPPFKHSARHLRLAQLPKIQVDEVKQLATESFVESLDLDQFVRTLRKKRDARVDDVEKALKTWGSLELVDASFKVIGERLVTPAAIIFLIVKLRLVSPTRDGAFPAKEFDVEEINLSNDLNDEKDHQFLTGRTDVEDLPDLKADEPTGRWAHAPYWPSNRKQSWWLVLADDKTNRIVVLPKKISDIPFSNPTSDRNFRSYKMQFQAPQGVGLFTWKVCLISDTFVGEEVSRDLALKIDDVSALNTDERGGEDEISDPDEDSLAGQMAAMRGGNVKRRVDSDEDSSTDDDRSGSDSNSDSD